MTIHPVALVTHISLSVIIQLVTKSSNLSTVDLSPTLHYYFLVQDLYLFCPDTKLSVNQSPCLQVSSSWISLLLCLLAAAAAKLLQSCLTLCDPIDGSPPGSPVPGILQARTLEWVAISLSNAESEKWKWSRSVVSDPQWPHGLRPSRLLHSWDFPGKSTGVGCHCLFLCLLNSPVFSSRMFTISLFLRLMF